MDSRKNLWHADPARDSVDPRLSPPLGTADSQDLFFCGAAIVLDGITGNGFSNGIACFEYHEFAQPRLNETFVAALKSVAAHCDCKTFRLSPRAELHAMLVAWQCTPYRVAV